MGMVIKQLIFPVCLLGMVLIDMLYDYSADKIKEFKTVKCKTVAFKCIFIEKAVEDIRSSSYGIYLITCRKEIKSHASKSFFNFKWKLFSSSVIG